MKKKKSKKKNRSQKKQSKKKTTVKGKRKHDEQMEVFDEDVSMDFGDEESDVGDEKPRIWIPGIDPLEENEVLQFDPGTYTVYETLKCEWPCLSFDIIKDKLGQSRTRFPLTMYMVVGTQSAHVFKNRIQVYKFSDIHKVEEYDSDDDEDDEKKIKEPVIATQFWKHPGGVNRIRSMPQHPNIIASWADTGDVHLWDCSQQLARLDKPVRQRLPTLNPLFSFAGHAEEGFAMDWSLTSPGSLITGDCSKHIYVWKPPEDGGGSWFVDKVPYNGHTDSVEDLQWSPNEATVFASCSMDKTIKIWDIRVKKKSMLSVDAHETDVNVISWNNKVSHLLVSGADDGSFKVWDLRNFKSNNPAANFKWHSDAITSVEWHPTDDSVIAAASADHTISIWDMSVEADPERKITGADLPKSTKRKIPPELLFIHAGQKDIKELHWHQSIPSLCVSTATDGFNIFKPTNMVANAAKTLDNNI